MREFEQVLAWLRALAWPCAPPIGVGEFVILYASSLEVVVWYSPAREGHRAGEVAIPCARLAAAWEALAAGERLDEAALTALGGGQALGRWLLALLALLPGAHVQADPLVLSWQPAAAPEPDLVEAAPAPATRRAARKSGRKAV